MKFVSISMENFLSIGEEQTISLAGRGLLAVFGVNKDAQGADSNGGGKSAAVCESVVWCLYGKTLRGMDGDAIVNTRAKSKGCRVALTMEEDGVTYVVTRTRCKPGKKPNDLILSVNGNVRASAGVNADTQEQVDAVVGMDMATFTQSVLLAHSIVPFSKLTDAAQKAILEDILQISLFAKAREINKIKLNTIKSQIVYLEAKLGELRALQTSIQSRHTQLFDAESSYMKVLAGKRAVVNKRLIELKAELDNIESVVDDADIEQEEQSIQQDTDKIKQADTELSNKSIFIAQKIGQERSATQQKIAVLQSQKQQIMADSAQVDQLAGTACPTCKQMVDADSADKTLAHWEERIHAIDAELAMWSTTSTSLSQLEQKMATEMQEKVLALQESAKAAQQRQQVLHNRIRNNEANKANFKYLTNQITHTTNELASLNDEKNPYTDLALAATAELADNNVKIVSLSGELSAAQTQLRYHTFWDTGFGNQGIKSYVLDNAIPFLNQRVQYYADLMSDGDLTIQFSTQKQLKTGAWKDEFQVNVSNQQGANVYEGNSDGEKRRSDLAVSWALGDLAASRAKKPIKLKILDEVMENLDEAGRTSVMKLLHAVVKEYETVIFISHNEELRNQFNNVLTVTKKDGMSRIS